MLRLIIRRLALAIPTLFVVVTFSFALVKMVPGDPAQYILGTSATQEAIAKLHHAMGLDKPVLDQYFSWLGNALQGNLGTSITTGQPVVASLAISWPVTMWLALISTLISLVIGVLFGTIAAVRGGWLDNTIQWIAGLGLAIPNFWVAFAIVLAFAIQNKIFPATGYVPMSDGFQPWLMAITLPAISLAVSGICQILLQARSSVLDVMSKDFVRTLQATGINRNKILYKHILRNASIPVTIVTGISLIGAFSGVVVIENIFNLPGLGKLLLNGVAAIDFPVVQGAVVLFSVLVIVVNLVIDILTALLDPRVRLA